MTPLESMPVWLQIIMKFRPNTLFFDFVQVGLYRSAGIEIVWPQLLAVVGIGMALFAIAFVRFKKAVSMQQ